MMTTGRLCIHAAAVSLLLLSPAAAQQPLRAQVSNAAPLTIGETFTIQSRVLGEERRINVYMPFAYADTPLVSLPVLYMPDGGIAEDFLHVAGLVQVSTGNGTMRPFILVGIENTERRRDMTGPTRNADDRKIAPRVGGSTAFRSFIRDELMPAVRARYRTTDESAIMGESLAGLFVVETYMLDPGMFDTYIAFDPSLWWNDASLVLDVESRREPARRAALYVATSNESEITALGARLMTALRARGTAEGLHQVRMPDESHATIYHPAALRALRTLFSGN